MVRAEIRSVAAFLRSEPGDEARILTASHLVAVCLALMWLALVFFGPRPIAPSIPDVVITVLPPVTDVLPTAPRELTRRAAASRARTETGRTRSGILDAFAAAPGTAGREDIVRGVRITPSVPTADPLVRGVHLGTSAGAQRPGRSRAPSEGVSGMGLGVVSREGVSRATVSIMPPDVRPTGGSGARGDATEVGQSARAYAPQLQRCYLDEGLTRNPGLAGLVRLAIDVEGGRVVSASVIDRTWTGAGVAETEGCLLRAVRSWRLGSSSGSMMLPFSFTSSGR